MASGTADKHRLVMIAMDGSKHSDYALECKYKQVIISTYGGPLLTHQRNAIPMAFRWWAKSGSTRVHNSFVTVMI